jgi:endo-beta-N-acetylglucosaminidase D
VLSIPLSSTSAFLLVRPVVADLSSISRSFSHHRVSPPPPSWIRAAHTHGVKILGTLIFEWDAGREDIVELVSPSSSFPSSSSSIELPSTRFKRLSTRYADYLVALAVERGFEGWLVNVEVDLGSGKKGEEKFQKEHAAAVVEWVRYLREKMHEKVVGAEVMWCVCSLLSLFFFRELTDFFVYRYDSVTVDGPFSTSLVL